MYPDAAGSYPTSAGSYSARSGHGSDCCCCGHGGGGGSSLYGGGSTATTAALGALLGLLLAVLLKAKAGRKRRTLFSDNSDLTPTTQMLRDLILAGMCVSLVISLNLIYQH